MLKYGHLIRTTRRNSWNNNSITSLIGRICIWIQKVIFSDYFDYFCWTEGGGKSVFNNISLLFYIQLELSFQLRMGETSP